VNAKQKAMARRGERIYRERYKAAYEKTHPGMFVAIDVRDGKAFLSGTPENAILTARASIPSGSFHLIRIGAPGVFRVAYSRRAT